MNSITYELKYCERCGSLGMRRSRSSETYCETCAQILTHGPRPGRGERRLLFRLAGLSARTAVLPPLSAADRRPR